MEDRPVEQAAGAVTAENLRLLGGLDGRKAREGEDDGAGDGASSTVSVMGTTVGAGRRDVDSDAGGDGDGGPAAGFEGGEESPLGEEGALEGDAREDGPNTSMDVHAGGECAPAAAGGGEDEADCGVEPSLVRLALDGYTPADSPLAGPAAAGYRGGGGPDEGRGGHIIAGSDQSASIEEGEEEEAGDDHEETPMIKPAESPHPSQPRLPRRRSPMKLARRCFAAQDAVDDAQYLAMPSEFLRGQRRAHAMAEESEGVPGPSGGVRRTRTWDDRGDGRAGGADGTIRHSASFGPSCIRQHGHAGGVRELHHENRRLDLRRGGIASLGGVLSTDDAVPSSGREPPKTSKERDEIGRLNGELAECRAEIGRLRSAMARHSRGPGRSQLVLNRSMLSDSESDDGDANGGAPAVALSPSQGDESYVRWQRRFEREMELECRREILLLRASLEKANRRLAAVGGGDGGDAGGAPFASDIEPIATSGDDDGVFLRIAEDLENDNDGPEDGGRGQGGEENVSLTDPALERELEDYRAALVESLRTDAALPTAPSSDSSERQKVNVKLLNAEDYVTDWTESVMLPPPNHELDSPVVTAVLDQWSDSDETRAALLHWFESTLSGDEGASVPPSLKVSGVDSNVRDGFLTHVVPLLLRNGDLDVRLATRAHRRTTYDIAVDVTPASDRPGGRRRPAPGAAGRDVGGMAFRASRSGMATNGDDESGELTEGRLRSMLLQGPNRVLHDLVRTGSGAGSVATAATTPVSNRSPAKLPVGFPGNKRDGPSGQKAGRGDASFPRDYPLTKIMSNASTSLIDDDDESDESIAEEEAPTQDQGPQQQREGLVSRALGGIMSMRRPAAAAPHEDYRTPSSSRRRHHPQPGAQRGGYERVVAAPPGKVGITLVEDENGRATVSSVSDSSPLSGWIFPSDVLAAVDGVSVDGLRLRDVVGLLASGGGRHRNLHLVSSRRQAADDARRRGPGTV